MRLTDLKDSIDSGLESVLSELPDGIEGVVRSILGTGIGCRWGWCELSVRAVED